MKKLFPILFFIVLISGFNSCRDNTSEKEQPGPALFPQPKSYSLNTKDGYKINPVTGDSIKPIINSLGDTVKTGVKIPAKGKLIHPDSVSKPKIVKVGKGKVVNAHTNRYTIPEKLPRILVDESKLTIIKVPKISNNDTSHYILNSQGNKVKTGVKIPAKGKKVKTIQPQSTPALPLRMKDNAITNIQYLDVDQGMSSSYVLSILEDKSGNLWFGTLGGGVSKYDGESFVHFTQKEGLSNNYVRFILEDKSGNLWFGTEGAGVSKYDGESFVHFTEREGLSNNNVLSILEDKNGNLWFGTYGGGVSKYDGESFIHFTEREGLSNNNVLSINEDKNGNLWFGTNGGGVSKYDGETTNPCRQGNCKHNMGVREDLEKHKQATSQSFVHFTESEGLSNNIVRSILEDKSGNLWFGTAVGVSKYDGETTNACRRGICKHNMEVREDFEKHEQSASQSIVNYTDSEGLSNNGVWSITEDKSGNLWFGTNGGGFSKYDGQSFVHLTESEGLSNNIVRCILEDKSGNLWFGTRGGGVSKYNGESFVHFTDIEGLSNDNSILSILEDKRGNLWFGTYRGGVSKYDGKSFVHFTDSDGLSNNNVLSILEDKRGNLWFGTEGGGVCKYDGESFVHFTESEGLSNNIVWSILEDKSGNLWFGTRGGGVCKYDGETTNPCRQGNCKHNMGVREDLEKHKQATSQSFVHFTDNEGLSNNYVRTILEDKSGNLWFGTNGGGVSKYDGETTNPCRQGNCKHNMGVREDLEKHKQTTSQSFVHFTEREGLSNNNVYSILEDKSGNLWFGTDGGGVCKYDGETTNPCRQGNCKHKMGVREDLEKHKQATLQSFVHFTDSEGLSNNSVWSILEDKSVPTGVGIWLSTEKGISEIKNEKLSSIANTSEHKAVKNEKDKLLKSNYSIQILIKQDGLKGLDFHVNSALIDSKNRAWWGSGKGLEMLDLNKFKFSQKIPQPVLKQIDINENFIDYRNISDSLKNEIVFSGVQRFQNYPLNLELPYDKNHLTFHFSAIDWAAPHKIKYQYKMEGLDENWSEVTDESKADFRNLPYGTYTFKVRAIGESQIWSKPFEYTFTIHPPWWHTTWFRVCYVSCFVLLLYLLFRWRTNVLRKQKIVLEKTVEERTQELKHEKEIVEEKHKEITDSINYAERLQRSLMASKNLLDKNLKDYFIYFNPKESVSGDFYWASELKNGNFLLTCADSTGHGVPGAIMSMMNMNSLKESVKEGSVSPNEILNQTRKIIIETLANDGSAEGGKDGMDCSLLSFDFKNNKLSFALANNPLWIIRQGEMLEFDADKMPVGKHDRDSVPFTHHEMDLQKGDMIYIFTDGYADQFGGEKGKKFKYSNLKKLLLENANLELETLNLKLSSAFSEWKGDLEQVDDVCIIGIRI